MHMPLSTTKQHISIIIAAYYFHFFGTYYNKVTRIIIDCDECNTY